MSHFKAARRGIKASFTAEEKEFLADVIPLLEGLGAPDDDPAAARLRIPVYLADDGSNEEWWRLMGPELADARADDRTVFQGMLDSGSTVLSDGDANAVLRVINEARLVLGARLGIDVEADHERVPVAFRQALDYLGWLQEELLVELSRSL